MTVTLTLSSQGQVVIPVDVRRVMGLKAGSKVTLTVSQQKPIPTAIMQPMPDSWTKHVRGIGKNIWGKGEEYIDKERSSWTKS